MQHGKTIKDTYGDDVIVDTLGNVYLTVNDSASRSSANASLTPEQARKIARALKRAANVAEGKPAKAPKPSVIVDGDGDDWHLSANGCYALFGPTDDANRTRSYLRAEYGIQEERP